LQIIRWFVQRWPVEVTFREARDHLGLETHRQWSNRAIARTTPCLLGLFSITALLGNQLNPSTKLAAAAAAWYHKTQPTFADTRAAVRKAIWAAQGFSMSRTRSDRQKLPTQLQDGIAGSVAKIATGHDQVAVAVAQAATPNSSSMKMA
jgi:hypothetical protein